MEVLTENTEAEMTRALLATVGITCKIERARKPGDKAKIILTTRNAAKLARWAQLWKQHLAWTR